MSDTTNSDPMQQMVYQYKQRTRSLFKFQEAYEITHPEDKKMKFFFAKRDRLWFKKDVKLFHGENDHGQPFVTLIDNSIFDMFGSFTILDHEGKHLALAKRNFLRSFFWRETWEIYNDQNNLLAFAEAKGSFIKTFVRKFRVLALIPVIGGILASLMRLQYEYRSADGTPFAEFKRKVSLRDFYRLTFNENVSLPVEKSAIIGMSVLFDAAENR